MFRVKSIAILTVLILTLTCSLAFAQYASNRTIYTETAAFVKWMSIVPHIELSVENIPQTFTGTVRNPSKLKSYGLPAKLGDTVRVSVVKAHTWKVEQGEHSVIINAKDKIPMQFYPSF